MQKRSQFWTAVSKMSSGWCGIGGVGGGKRSLGVQEGGGAALNKAVAH